MRLISPDVDGDWSDVISSVDFTGELALEPRKSFDFAVIQYASRLHVLMPSKNVMTPCTSLSHRFSRSIRRPLPSVTPCHAKVANIRMGVMPSGVTVSLCT